MLLRVTVSLLCCWVIAACSPVIDDIETSYYYSIPPGSTLVLNRDIEIPADQVSVLLQAGRIVSPADIDHFRPHCKFELFSISGEPRAVSAGRFDVVSVYNEVNDVSAAPVLYAGLGLAYDGPAVFTYTTVLRLRSDDQPDVYRLSCMHWEDISDDRFLTLGQMRAALGDILTIELQGDAQARLPTTAVQAFARLAWS